MESEELAPDGYPNISSDELAESTRLAYERTFRRFQEKYAIQAQHVVTNDELVELLKADAESERIGWSMRTWRAYKAAVMYVLNKDPYGNADAIDSLRELSSRGMQRHSTRGPGRKLKNVPTDVASRLLFTLGIREEIGQYDRVRKYSDVAANTLAASMKTGLRPIEWLGAVIGYVFDDSQKQERLALTVKNGKYNRIRANGRSRTIFIDEYSQDELDVIQNVIAAFAEHEGQLRKLRTEINRELQRGLRKLAKLGQIEQRYTNITLYSARHQFAADAKSANLPYREIAALLGHKSQKTASWHYARKQTGRGSVQVSPSAASVAEVGAREPRMPEHERVGKS